MIREIFTQKIRPLSLKEADKFMFLYFYIYAFCSLTDRQTIYRDEENLNPTVSNFCSLTD